MVTTLRSYYDEVGNRYEATSTTVDGKTTWHSGYEDPQGTWHDVPLNQMPLDAYTDQQLNDLQYSKDSSFSPQQRQAVETELHDRAIDSGQIHTYTDENGNRYEATSTTVDGETTWHSGYQDPNGVWHDVPLNQMPLDTYTDQQLHDLQDSKDASLSPQQREAVEDELHDRAIDAGEKVGPGAPKDPGAPDDADATQPEAARQLGVETLTGGQPTPGQADPFDDAATLWKTATGHDQSAFADLDANDDVVIGEQHAPVQADPFDDAATLWKTADGPDQAVFADLDAPAADVGHDFQPLQAANDDYVIHEQSTFDPAPDSAVADPTFLSGHTDSAYSESASAPTPEFHDLGAFDEPAAPATSTADTYDQQSLTEASKSEHGPDDSLDFA